MSESPSRLEVRVLGPLEVLRDGEPVELPPSRKTRALLAYLTLTARPQRRERLCELFWDVPDDPKGALRWSLSKLRPLVNPPGHERLVADRASVGLDRASLTVDRDALDEVMRSGFDGLSVASLESLADTVRGAFLEDLALPRCEQFEAWRTAESLAASRAVTRLLDALVRRLRDDPDRALRHVARLRGLATDTTAADALVARSTRRGSRRSSSTAGAAAEEQGVGSTPAASELPCIAVLPFHNLSGDPDQAYFSDGITEEIITELSRFRALRVIARNSTFALRDRAVGAEDIRSRLGASYMVEGSVRRAAKRVRVTAQLIETASGSHVWAERYDRLLGDVLTLQEEVARTIVAAIEPALGSAERRRAEHNPPTSLTAWDHYLRGTSEMYAESLTGNQTALAHFERAMSLDPRFAPACAGAAYVRFNDLIYGYREQTPVSIEEAFQLARRAVHLDDRDAMAHLVLGRLQLLRLDHEASIAELERATALNPSYADAHHGLAFTLVFSGHPEAAIPHFDAAIRLSPFDPRIASFHEMRAWALIVLDRPEEALVDARTAVRRPDAGIWEYATLCAALGCLGRPAEAVLPRQDLLSRRPGFCTRFVRDHVFYNRNPEHLERYIRGLLAAGVPE